MKTTPFYITLLLLLISSNFELIFSQAASTVQVNGTNSVNTILNNVATVVDPNLTVAANGTITDFTVTITESFVTGDLLSYTGSLPSGVTASSFNTTTHSIVFSGTATAANWQTFLRTVTLQTTSVVCNPESRKVAFIAGGGYYNPLNDHYYKIYLTNGSWTNGKSYAASQSYFGMQGYLATLTSQAENSFISFMVGQNSWIGCSDNYLQINEAVGYTLFANQNASEGQWYWVCGPEKGTKIRNGNAVLPNTGSAVSGVYQNWNTNEPNDYPTSNTTAVGQEDYGHVYASSAKWNDFPNSMSIFSVMEFGGMPNDLSTSQVMFERSLYINGAPSGTLSGGNGSVCPGTNSTVLTLTGFSGTVVKWQYSDDNFITAGVDIANTATTYTVANISSTRYYRAIVNSSSGCTGLATSSTVVNVSNTIAGNITADNNTICPNGEVNLNLFGNYGDVVKWQKSTSSTFASAVTDINSTLTSLNHTLSAAGTYYFRAVVQNGSCSQANTAGYTIVVSSGTPPQGGVVSHSEHCGPGTFSGTLTLSNYTGSIQKWQYTNDGLIWIDVANTTSSLSYSGVSSNRIYRAVLTNGSCGTANSTEGIVTVYGSTITKWLGTTSTDWGTASNWCGGIADNGIDAIVSTTATNHLVLDQDRLIGSFNFNSVNVNILLGNHTLIASDVILEDQSRFVKTDGSGILKMSISNGQSKNFPVGKTTYNPVAITNHTGAGDYFSVNVEDQVYLNGVSGAAPTTPHVQRTWNIAKTNLNGGSGIDLRFQWNSGEESTSLAVPTVNHYNGLDWEIAAGTHANTTNTASVTGYTGTFSPFAIGSDDKSPLPITLDYFNGTCQNSDVKLSWSTLSEINAANYQIEKAKDNYTWNTVGIVPAAGNSQVKLNYEWIDPQVSREIVYYRLVQRDFDGKENRYGPISVGCDTESLTLDVFPNPARDQFNINVQSKSVTELLIHIESAQGQFILAKAVDLKAGSNNIPIQTNGWADGVYLIRLQLNGQLITKKVVVEH